MHQTNYNLTVGSWATDSCAHESAAYPNAFGETFACPRLDVRESKYYKAVFEFSAARASVILVEADSSFLLRCGVVANGICVVFI